MADLAQERVLLHRQLRQLFIGISQLGGGPAQFGGLFFKLVGILQHLRRFICNRQKIFHGNSRSSNNLADHRMRRSGSHRPAQLSFKCLDEGRGWFRKVASCPLTLRFAMEEILRLS